jgi:hypothetical protein
MIHKVKEILFERNLSPNYPIDVLYKAGMDNVKENIEFYFDKTYTCESVIKELFVRGVIKYIESNNSLIAKRSR